MSVEEILLASGFTRNRTVLNAVIAHLQSTIREKRAPAHIRAGPRSSKAICNHSSCERRAAIFRMATRCLDFGCSWLAVEQVAGCRRAASPRLQRTDPIIEDLINGAVIAQNFCSHGPPNAFAITPVRGPLSMRGLMSTLRLKTSLVCCWDEPDRGPIRSGFGVRGAHVCSCQKIVSQHYFFCQEVRFGPKKMQAAVLALDRQTQSRQMFAT